MQKRLARPLGLLAVFVLASGLFAAADLSPLVLAESPMARTYFEGFIGTKLPRVVLLVEFGSAIVATLAGAALTIFVIESKKTE